METRKKIIRSAIEVFAEKGKHGATVEEISKKAGVNKAMVYYYYDSKQNLLLEVLTTILEKLMRRIVYNLSQIASEGDDPVSNVKHFVSAHFRAFSLDNQNSKILMDIFANDPVIFEKALERMKLHAPDIQMPSRIMDAFRDGVEKKIFREIDYSHVIICFIGMCMTWFIMKPLAISMTNLKMEDEATFLAEHEKAITEILLKGISV